MDDGKTATTALGRRCAVTVDDSVAYGAMSSLAASGASDGIHVSVSNRMSSLLSAMTSWISAAL